MIYFFFGTTAEYIKLIPVISKVKKSGIGFKVVLSGQTSIDMAEFKKISGLSKPNFEFEEKNSRSSSLFFAIWAIRTFVKSLFWGLSEFRFRKSNVMIIQGDTVSALIGSILGRVFLMRVVHVEAGLRTKNLMEPFPEEINRRIISLVTNYHFCQNKDAMGNLKNVPASRKFNTLYNTSIESLEMAISLKGGDIGAKKHGKYFIFILHRQEHLYLRKRETVKLIEEVMKFSNKGIKCYFLIHDVTKEFLVNTGLYQKIEKSKYMIPMGRMKYLDFVHFFNRSQFAITDGGGNHTEAHYLGKPCVILKRESEQTEGVGENILVTEDLKKVKKFIKEYKLHNRKKLKIKKWPSEVIMGEIKKIV